MFIINPVTIYPVAKVNGFPGTLWDVFYENLTDLSNWNFGVMWFVAALLVFALAYSLWRQLTNSSGIPTQGEGPAPSNAQIAIFALALGVATFIVRLWIPVGDAIPVINIQPAHFVQYIALYIVGIFAYRRGWFAKLSDSQGKTWLVVVLALIVLFPVLFIAGGAMEGVLDPFFGGLHWQSFAYSVWEEFMCIAMIVTLLVWFRRRFTEQGPITQAMSGAAYATYVFHPPVIVFLAVALREINLDMALKYIMVVPFAVGLSFLTGYIVKKLPVARNIL
jgi:surface polysaccharide O-acyltransferase-like enzyme